MGIAPDVIALTQRRPYDTALVVSHDHDLAEVAEEIQTVAREEDRWIKSASAFQQSSASRKGRVVKKTHWVRIDRAPACHRSCQREAFLALTDYGLRF